MEAIKANEAARKVIDSSIIVAALRHYKKDVTPLATEKLMTDLNRLIAEFDITAKIPLHIDDSGQLVIAGPDNTDPERVTSLNTITVE